MYLQVIHADTPFYGISISVPYFEMCAIYCEGINFCISNDELLQTYKDCHHVLVGDGRCTLRVTYSLMDTATNKILHAEIIYRQEINLRFPNMEWQGLLHAPHFMMAKLHDSVIVDEVITDASTSV